MFDLVKFRKDNHLTQTQLGRLLDKDQAYISQIEKGDRPLLEEYINILRLKFNDINSYIKTVENNSRNNPPPMNANESENLEHYLNKIRELQNEIENLKRLLNEKDQKEGLYERMLQNLERNVEDLRKAMDLLDKREVKNEPEKQESKK